MSTPTFRILAASLFVVAAFSIVSSADQTNELKVIDVARMDNGVRLTLQLPSDEVTIERIRIESMRDLDDGSWEVVGSDSITWEREDAATPWPREDRAIAIIESSNKFFRAAYLPSTYALEVWPDSEMETPLVAGTTVQVPINVTNVSNEAIAKGKKILVTVTLEGPDQQTVATGEKYLAVGSLAPDDSRPVFVPLKLESGQATGEYRILASVPAEGSHTSPSQSSATTLAVAEDLPDLMPEGPSTVLDTQRIVYEQGAKTHFTWTLHNQGNTLVRRGQTGELALALEPLAEDRAPVPLEPLRTPLGVLQPGQKKAMPRVSLDLPANLAQGQYRLTGILDADDEVRESNEVNNTFQIREIHIAPEFVDLELTVNPVSEFDSLLSLHRDRVDVVLTNRGNIKATKPTEVELWAVRGDAQPTFAPPQKRLGKVETQTFLQPGQHRTVPFHLNEPVIVPCDTYRLVARSVYKKNEAGEVNQTVGEAETTVNGPLKDFVLVNPSVLDVENDIDSGGRLVTLQFQVKDAKGHPVNNLDTTGNGDFYVFEDGQQEVSGEVRLGGEAVIDKKIHVALCLDTSSSMEQQHALTTMKEAANALVRRLKSTGKAYHFTYYQFANQVDSLDSLSEINSRKAYGQFTSLHSAVKQAIEDAEVLRIEDKSILSSTFVVLSDGKDTWSHNPGANPKVDATELETLLNSIRDKDLIIHTIGLGGVNAFDGEYDLRRLNVGGGDYFFANSRKELVARFTEAADHIAAVYTLTYLSNHQTGEHELEVVVARDGLSGTSVRKDKEPRYLTYGE